jgi:hypothetical protein
VQAAAVAAEYLPTAQLEQADEPAAAYSPAAQAAPATVVMPVVPQA